jgi:hypothetical protein
VDAEIRYRALHDPVIPRVEDEQSSPPAESLTSGVRPEPTTRRQKTSAPSPPAGPISASTRSAKSWTWSGRQRSRPVGASGLWIDRTSALTSLPSLLLVRAATSIAAFDRD